MKMSAYFRKPKMDPFQRRHTATAQPNLTMNSDLDTSNRAVVKLRLDKTHQKPPAAPSSGQKK